MNLFTRKSRRGLDMFVPFTNSESTSHDLFCCFPSLNLRSSLQFIARLRICLIASSVFRKLFWMEPKGRDCTESNGSALYRSRCFVVSREMQPGQRHEKGHETINLLLCVQETRAWYLNV